MKKKTNRSAVTPEWVSKYARMCELKGGDEHSDLHLEIVTHFIKMPVVLALFDPPPDHFTDAQRFAYWNEALEYALEEAREETIGVK